MQVIKRNGQITEFRPEKISRAIELAMNSPQGLFVPGQARRIAEEIEESVHSLGKETLSVYQIEDLVYYALVEAGNAQTARAYENYKAVQAYKRRTNTTDSVIESLLNATNAELMDENSNKNARVIATQRDLIAGEVSKDIAKRLILPTDVLEAHETGAIHVHDLDYMIQPMFNCCLINLADMLKNGTMINGKMIDEPRSFQVACTVTTQIIAQVASSQFGGQSINGLDRILAPYVRKSYEKYLKQVLEEQREVYHLTEPDLVAAEKIAWQRTKKEVKDGVQTIQYQINTLMTTNGQSPFVTLFLYLDPKDSLAKEAALITEEILNQRITGIKNAAGIHVTPAFPKLIYVLDEHNIHPDAPYYYLTELAAKCSARRMYPDYISAKKMKQLYEGNVFSPMGCRAFLPAWTDETGAYRFDGRFNQGVVTINLPQIAILSKGDESQFFQLLEKRLELMKKALMVRHERLEKVTSDVSPIHWQHGAIARLAPGESIKKYLHNGYSTLTMGYIGIYEASLLITGKSHTTPEGEAFAMRIMEVLNAKKEEWTEAEKVQFAVYGTPAESLTHRFCSLDFARFGSIENVTDKGYYTNSYHVDVREPIDVFSKFRFEQKFQERSTGGMISYVEIPNMNQNVPALLTLIRFIYDNIMYAEFNTRSDYCHECGYDGEIRVNEDGQWECPQCGNHSRQHLTVVRRTCGYLGENFWNEGRTKEIEARVLHI
ncbi:Ribonucleotide reductase of class III (anaerobic), large subunit [Clostridiaceae bacterium JG1575]|nr:Ribonucleotide reductase of class III (anaerobic), large subunit [Clostridiaceae bacterium JG1575]